MTQESINKFLVVGPAWVGDMVMAQSLFMCLKEQYPDCKISVLAPDWTRPLLERMPEVERGISIEMDHGDLKLSRRRAFGKSLRAEGFTTAIVLPNSFKSALIPYHAAIPNRIAWKGEWRNMLLSDCRRLDKAAFPLMVQRFAALAFPASAQPPSQIPDPRLKSDQQNVDQALGDFGLSLGSKVLAICPGAEFGEAKQWPAEHFAACCSAKIDEGWQVWIFGSKKDMQVADEVLQLLSVEQRHSCVSLAGRTSLAQAIDLLSVASAVISNDSGLMHIAAALDKPVVALYGSTSPDFTPPLSEKSRLLFTDIECRPCFKRKCPLGHKKCLTELEPSRAVAAIEELAPASGT
ncbi:MAG: lipopolysaccharide heptosyltransferase II [Pseudohongiella sp.]|nr:MAG: lipopolysaccharide heptosyltransferase II [Pseudohongiella sp.]